MTYKGKKSGFSLVEVMVLFTVLSIALVGSMKMITRKKSAIPKKASHGVYRCIATQNGYFQELYRGSHRVDSGNTSECKFRVPEAAMYKLDVYSAGSGGNLGAEVVAQLEPAKIAFYTLGDGIVSSNPEEVNVNASDTQLHIPSDEDLYRYFNGRYYVNSFYTNDAGIGGGTALTYESVKDATCGIDIDAWREKLEEKADKLRGILDKLHDYAYIVASVDADFAGSKAILYNNDPEKAWGGHHNSMSSTANPTCTKFVPAVPPNDPAYELIDARYHFDENDHFSWTEGANPQLKDFYKLALVGSTKQFTKISLDELPHDKDGNLLRSVRPLMNYGIMSGVPHICTASHGAHMMCGHHFGHFVQDEQCYSPINANLGRQGSIINRFSDRYFWSLDKDEELQKWSKRGYPKGDGAGWYASFDDSHDIYEQCEVVVVENSIDVERDESKQIMSSALSEVDDAIYYALIASQVWEEKDIKDMLDEAKISDVALASMISSSISSVHAKWISQYQRNAYRVDDTWGDRIWDDTGYEFEDFVDKITLKIYRIGGKIMFEDGTLVSAPFGDPFSQWTMRDRIYTVTDDDGEHEHISGFRFGDYVNAILDDLISTIAADVEKRLADIEKELKAEDIKDNVYFNNKYTERDTTNEQVVEQFADYCRLSFPIYFAEEAPNANIYDMLAFGERHVNTLGGAEGLGKLARLTAKINYSKNTKQTFAQYMKNFKTNYQPLACSSTQAESCSTSKFDILINEQLSKGKDGKAITATYSRKSNDKNNNKLFRIVYELAADITKTYVLAVREYVLAGVGDNGFGNSSYFNTNDNGKTDGTDPDNGDDDKHGHRPGGGGGGGNNGGGNGGADTPMTVDGEDVPTGGGNNGGGIGHDLPDIDFSDHTYRLMNTVDGESPKYYPAWKVPGNKVAKIEVLTGAQPQGGEKRVVYIDESKANMPRSSNPAYSYVYQSYHDFIENPNLIFQWFPNLAYPVNADKPAKKGDDREEQTITDGVNYSIYTLDEHKTINNYVENLTDKETPAQQEPRLRMWSEVWSKEYKIGQSGKIGRVESTNETNLGKNCEFNVARPGKVNRLDIDDIDDLTSALATTVKCYDEQGNTVLDKTVKGNGYNEGYAANNQTRNRKFSWTRSLEAAGSFVVSLAERGQTPAWNITSMWSKLFANNMITDSGTYDIQSVYGVGKAGDGTTLTDKCLVPKGEYESYMQYILSSYDRTKPRQRVSDSETLYSLDDDAPESHLEKPDMGAEVIKDLLSTREDIISDGEYKGFDCYDGEDAEYVTNEDEEIVRSTFKINENSLLNKHDRITITAGQGGGGAVVITW